MNERDELHRQATEIQVAFGKLKSDYEAKLTEKDRVIDRLVALLTRVYPPFYQLSMAEKYQKIADLSSFAFFPRLKLCEEIETELYLFQLLAKYGEITENIVRPESAIALRNQLESVDSMVERVRCNLHNIVNELTGSDYQTHSLDYIIIITDHLRKLQKALDQAIKITDMSQCNGWVFSEAVTDDGVYRPDCPELIAELKKREEIEN